MGQRSKRKKTPIPVQGRVSGGWTRANINQRMRRQVDLIARDEEPGQGELDAAFETIRDRFTDFAKSLGLVAIWNSEDGSIIISRPDGKPDNRWWPVLERRIEDIVREVTWALSEELDRSTTPADPFIQAKSGPTFRLDLVTELGKGYETVKSFRRNGVSRYRLLRIMNRALRYPQEHLRVVMIYEGAAWDITAFFRKICSELQDEVFGVCAKPTPISCAEDILRAVDRSNLINDEFHQLKPREGSSRVESSANGFDGNTPD